MEKVKEQRKYIDEIKDLNKNNKNLKYCILTMGCQLNENDSEKLCGMLEEMGYTRTEKFEESDIALFNTCCVRENAEDMGLPRNQQGWGKFNCEKLLAG